MVHAGAVDRVECSSDRSALGQHGLRPFMQGHLATGVLELQSRFAPARGNLHLVACDGPDLGGCIGRAFHEQAVQEKDVEKARGLRGDADRGERVEVHGAHLDILRAAFAQRAQRPLAGQDHPFGANGAVELVLDLQQGCRKLAIVVTIADAYLHVRCMGPRERRVE